MVIIQRILFAKYDENLFGIRIL